MKTPLLVGACSLVSLAVGAALGWRQGQWRTEREWRARLESGVAMDRADAAPKPAGPGRHDTAAESADARHEGASGETDAVTAKRLFDQLLARGPALGGGPPLELFPFLNALGGCSAAEVEEMLDVIAEQTRTAGAAKRSVGGELENLILYRYAALEPESALRRAFDPTIKAGTGKKDSVAQIAFAKVLDEPTRARQMLESLPADVRQAGERAWLRARANADPDAVLTEFIAQPPTAPNDQQLAADLFARKLATAPDEALNFAAKTTATARASLITEGVRAWFERDPEAAAVWTKSSGEASAWLGFLKASAGEPINFAPGEMRERLSELPPRDPEATGALAGALAADLTRTSSPEEALKWANGLAGPARDGAIGEAGAAWIRTDAVAASEWLTTVPPGDVRDRLACSLVQTISSVDRESAERWAASIQAEPLRAEAQTHIHGNESGTPRERESPVR